MDDIHYIFGDLFDYAFMFDFVIMNDKFIKINIKLIEDFMKCEYLNYILNGISEDEPRIMKLELTVYLKKLDNIKYGDREYYLLNLKRLLKNFNKKDMYIKGKKINNIELKFNYDCSLNIIKITIFLEETESIRKDDKIIISPVYYLGLYIGFIFQQLEKSKYFQYFVNEKGKFKKTIKEKLKDAEGEDLRDLMYSLNSAIQKHYYFNMWIFVGQNLEKAHNIPDDKISIFLDNMYKHNKKRYDGFLLDVKDIKDEDDDDEY